MNDDQLNFMTNTMKNTDPQIIKQNYKMQTGIELTDEQVKGIQNMMNPQMMRQAAEMAKNNPEMMRQAQA
jgi:cell division GTPase FtsZ